MPALCVTAIPGRAFPGSTSHSTGMAVAAPHYVLGVNPKIAAVILSEVKDLNVSLGTNKPGTWWLTPRPRLR